MNIWKLDKSSEMARGLEEDEAMSPNAELRNLTKNRETVMSKISNADFYVVNALKSNIEKKLKNCGCLEEASQKFIDIIYEEFEESVVLSRVFVTVPFENLPSPNQAFVTKLAHATRVSHLIDDRTLVLSLLGTRGKVADWNDRRKSKGHIGIPLVSADFIDTIPMMSRLFKDMGADLSWIDSKDTKIVIKTMGSMAGVFHVPDAKTATDQKGRKIIAAQDFVDMYKVKTVFGFGGIYGIGETFIITIIFTSEILEKKQAEQFMFLINTIKSVTTELVSKGRIFA